MTFDVRLLGQDDRTAVWHLGSLAFGYHHQPPPDDLGTPPPPGMRTWGSFDEAGTLTGRAVDLEQGQWFGGRIVPAAGVAGVSVTPELRGRGLGRALLTRLLAGARERGAAISSLFPTTVLPYRRLGWELAGALTYTAWPTSVLAGVRAPRDVRLRPAREADLPAIEALYRGVARAGTGMMERTGRHALTIGDTDGLTVATGPGDAVIGYSSWDRGPGYDASGRITVHDLIGSTAEATAALLAMAGSWASVAPTVVLRLTAPDPALLMIPPDQQRVESHQPWMLRLVDAPGAIAARGWPAGVSGAVTVELTDDVCPWNAGTYRLVLDGGEARLEPGGPGPAVRFGPRGLALWYAGAATPAVLRRTGLLDGDDGADDLLLAATAGPPPALHDYF